MHVSLQCLWSIPSLLEDNLEAIDMPITQVLRHWNKDVFPSVHGKASIKQGEQRHARISNLRKFALLCPRGASVNPMNRPWVHKS